MRGKKIKIEGLLEGMREVGGQRYLTLKFQSLMCRVVFFGKILLLCCLLIIVVAI